LDILINNAGLASNEYKKTVDGFEADFAVNVIAPYLLTTLLLDTLKESEGVRVITLTGGDLPSKIQLDNIQSEKSFNGLSTYSQTKMIMMCLMYEFSQRQLNSNITMNICYPGQASTSMTQNVTTDMLPFLMRPLFPIFKLLVRPDNGKSAKKASRSSVYLASSKDVENKTGIYCDKNVQLKEMPKVVTDEYNRKYIWDIVTELTTGKI
jgi:NAD(P)-dependent dehydrogenase (short-subunit alcohol dehydrogenase family)